MTYHDLPANPSLSYQWSWEDQAGNHVANVSTDSNSYTLTVDDLGYYINLRVTYANISGADVTKLANNRIGPVAPPIIPPGNLSATVSGATVTLRWTLDTSTNANTPIGFQYRYTPTLVNNFTAPLHGTGQPCRVAEPRAATPVQLA